MIHAQPPHSPHADNPHLRADRRGLSLLLLVVVLGASAFVLILSSSFLGIGEAGSGFVHDQIQEVQVSADGCVDETLRRLRLDAAYTGGTLVLAEGSCIISVVGAGSNRTVSVTSTIDAVSANAVVELSIVSSTITITSWE